MEGVSQAILKLASLIDAVNEWVGKAISPAILVMSGLMGAGVLARYVFRVPIVWVDEAVLFISGAYFMLAGGYILLHQGHVNVDVLYGRLGPRHRAIADLVTSAVFFVFCAALLWKGAEMAWSSFLTRERSPLTTWMPPLYPLKMVIPLSAFLLLLQGLSKWMRDLVAAVQGDGKKP